MSGICGLVSLDGAPVEARALRAMASAMAFRGPDRLDVRTGAGAGFAHALLRTDPESPGQAQPLSFDGRTWLVADVRIDARDELRRALAARGRRVEAACEDAALVLHAWHAWGEDCVTHLLGDYALAIWEADRRRLFLATDRFGVKPLFHARVGEAVAFGNTFDSLRAHSGVGDDPDESALADFLLFERSLEPGATGLAAIRRVPPASRMTFDRGGVRCEAYWHPPQDTQVDFRRAGDYAERFREVLQLAVDDRLRARRVTVQMSGGLDSTALAALARRSLCARHAPFDLRAHTVVYDSLLPDEERHFSTLAARSLGIPVTHHAGDEDRLYGGFERYAARFPEPFHGPDLGVGFAALEAAAGRARVTLTGYDGDALLNDSPKPYWLWLVRRGRWLELARSTARHAWRRRRLWPRSRGEQTPAPPFPEWIQEALSTRLGLRERWEAFHRKSHPRHALRPNAHARLADMLETPALFDQYDAGVTGLALECRHPFLDLRVVEFCLALPPEPWCVGKEVLRRAMDGILPAAIVRRPKTPLAGWAGRELMRREDSAWVDAFVAAPQLDPYVKRRSIPRVCGNPDALSAWAALRPLTLDLWLRHLNQPRTASEEIRHETA